MKEMIVNIAKQRLTLTEHGIACAHYSISTAKNGIGQLSGSECTPLGHHIVAEKYGEGMPINTVFVARQPTGEIYTPELALLHPSRDWILTRILWLRGCEEGINLNHTEDGLLCDSYQRYIYIHGTPDAEPMGIPCSHGCIRMRHADLLHVFQFADIGTPIFIYASL